MPDHLGCYHIIFPYYYLEYLSIIPCNNMLLSLCAIHLFIMSGDTVKQLITFRAYFLCSRSQNKSIRLINRLHIGDSNYVKSFTCGPGLSVNCELTISSWVHLASGGHL